jgi:shikimate kinase
MLIFLIGFMGSGKSYWAEKLSTSLKVPWYDLDRIVEEKEGMEVREIFSNKGEEYFRDLEHLVLAEFVHGYTASENIQAILSCGGGTPCFRDNMDLMNGVGKTIWLDPPLGILVSRLDKDSGKRPVLAGKKGKELENFIELKLEERKPWYEKAWVVIKEPMPTLQNIIKQIDHD